MIKTLTSNQNPFHFKDLNHLKQNTTKLQHAFILNRMSADVDANIVIVIVIVLVQNSLGNVFRSVF